MQGGCSGKDASVLVSSHFRNRIPLFLKMLENVRPRFVATAGFMNAARIGFAARESAIAA
jgi:hypothetical protein